MKTQNLAHALLSALLCMIMFASLLLASETPASNGSSKNATAAPAVQANNADAMRVQGEQRFRTNCGRCHAAPQKFPPRMMKTVLRHMRVRATITDEDMRLVLFYMTQ
jgi:cytochrome c5